MASDGLCLPPMASDGPFRVASDSRRATCSRVQVGRGELYVQASRAVLVFISAGYMDSTNCMRELLMALHLQRPVIVMLEPDLDRHGGMSIDEIREAVHAAAERYSTPGSGLCEECRAWGFEPPSAEELLKVLHLHQLSGHADGSIVAGPVDPSQGRTLRELGLLAKRPSDAADRLGGGLADAERVALSPIFEWERIGAFQVRAADCH